MTSRQSKYGKFDPSNMRPLEGWPGDMPPDELHHRIRKLFETHKRPSSGAMGYDWYADGGGVVVVLIGKLLRADMHDITTSELQPGTGYFWGEDYETGDLCVVDINLFFEALRRLRQLQLLDDLANI